MTLCIPHRNDEVWLGMKKKGFGAGRWNGFGGKVKTGETIEQAAVREMEEESGCRVNQLEKLGVLLFQNGDMPELVEMHLFKTTDFPEALMESEEMRPQRFKISEMPFDEMWESDRYWMPYFLAGKEFEGEFTFDNSDHIIEAEVREVVSA
ncbi:8-oxo-dGTP diphosphatase [Patescibacteria group bacterium]|nr:8-oxo-dGTP diphosphatase [Patescibacteria group bacterium]